MYELLKQLKEVGFPQRHLDSNYDGWSRHFYEEENVRGNTLTINPSGEDTVYEPTTEELIEELGDSLGRIYRRDAERWVVTEPLKFMVSDGKGGEVEEETKNFYGTSLKEALIHMYISLHSK